MNERKSNRERCNQKRAKSVTIQLIRMKYTSKHEHMSAPFLPVDTLSPQRIFKRLCAVRLRSNYKQNVTRHWRMDGCVVEACSGYKFGWFGAGRLCPDFAVRTQVKLIAVTFTCMFVYVYMHIGMICRRVYRSISLNAFICPHLYRKASMVYMLI